MIPTHNHQGKFLFDTRAVVDDKLEFLFRNIASSSFKAGRGPTGG